MGQKSLGASNGASQENENNRRRKALDEFKVRYKPTEPPTTEPLTLSLARHHIAQWIFTGQHPTY